MWRRKVWIISLPEDWNKNFLRNSVRIHQASLFHIPEYVDRSLRSPSWYRTAKYVFIVSLKVKYYIIIIIFVLLSSVST